MKNSGQSDSTRLRISMDFYGFRWISMDFYGFLWISMDFYGFVAFTRLGIVVSGTHGSRVSLPDGNVQGEHVKSKVLV